MFERSPRQHATTSLSLGLALALALGGCEASGDDRQARRRDVSTTTTPPAPAIAAPPPSPDPHPAEANRYSQGDEALPVDPHATAMREAAERGLRVWVEVDLAARWRAGPEPFAEGVRRLRDLSRIPGVVGFKLADELAYRDGFDAEPEAVRRFLADAARALRQEAPGAQLLIDLYVPELGCLPGSAHEAAVDCRQRTRAKQPALALPELDRLLAERTVDVVDISTGLREEDVYRSWGASRDQAQRAAWAEMRRRRWHDLVTLQSRKALAAPGGWQGPERAAARDAKTFVDIPLEQGAAAVDIWTWRQQYRGETVQLMSPGFRPNPLWRELETRHRAGARLITHFTPSNVERSVSEDLDVLSTVFSDLFMAGGIG